MRYKIDFGPVFLLCIIIMIFGQMWTYLGELPEVFTYGSFIYKVVGVISFILTNSSHRYSSSYPVLFHDTVS
jgi:hypothetical protein